jgi:signal peptide peptidase-like protein 3
MYGSYRSVSFEKTFRQSLFDDDSVAPINYKMAIALPVVSSVTLLLLFFYFGIISQLLLAVTCTMGTLAIIFCLYPLASMLFPSLTKRELRVCCCKIAAIFYILGVVAIICILLWLFTGHALLSNFIAVSWCILSMSIYRVPNLKIATIVLIGLFFYDIFWVFFSHHFFGKNVMTEVVTKQAVNPMNTIAQALHVSGKVVRELQLPMVLIVGHHRLGLGDIIIPGMLLAYTLKVDTHFKQINPLRNGYFLLGLCGYLVGFHCALVVVVYYRVAQPALLYLVPLTMLPVILLSIRRNEFFLIWNGISRIKKEEKDTNLPEV